MPSREAVAARNEASGTDNEVSSQAPVAERRMVDISLQERPLAGVLMSASADMLGEIFPIYVGRNTIGSAQDNDVCLAEATVAPNHAVLLVRQLPDGNGGTFTQISLTDYDSEYGTTVNGERIGFDRAYLQGGEVLRIGGVYTLRFFAFDASRDELGESPVFRATPRMNRRAPQVVEVPKEEEKPEENFADSIGADDEAAFYGRSKGREKQNSHNTTMDNLSVLYGDAAKRTPGVAPGTVVK